MNQVLILLGPTGVGKTGASVLLAKELDTEIIGADSMQIYRTMDIGTAKPSGEERGGVPHHMIDVVDPSEAFSAGRYVEMVLPIIESLHSRGKVPVIVGGTGLYIKALTRGIFTGPSADWGLREELLSLEEGEKGSLYCRLLALDPEAAARIEKNDVRRTVRALEVCLRSRERISLLQEKCTAPLPYEFIKIGLTRNREELYRLIDARVDDMVRSGFEGEVKRLLDGRPDRTPLQAIGYREFASFLQGQLTKEEAVSLTKRNTRRYAKRQFTWFRKEEGIRWVDVTGRLTSERVFSCLKELLLNSHAGLFPDRPPRGGAVMYNIEDGA